MTAEIKPAISKSGAVKVSTGGGGVIDFDLLYREIQKQSLTRQDIQRLTGCSAGAVNQVVDSFSLRYPVYEIAPGVFALLRPGKKNTIRCK